VLLKGKNAVIYGAGGAIGGAVARTFAGAGARVFLAGRTRASLDAVADADLPIDDFTVPIAAHMRTHLLTARAAARHMLEAGSG
jgi:NAD(P)-dependent dehydrogenase (short-subunit alcohol dehydrogenase family)